MDEIIGAKNFIGSNRNNAGKSSKTCAELASKKKAEDIVVLDLRGISSDGLFRDLLGRVRTST